MLGDREDGDLPIVIAGAGGMGREAHTWLRDLDLLDRVAGFVAGPDTPPGTTALGLPVWSDLDTPRERFGPLEIVLGVGLPAIKRRVTEEGAALGCRLRSVVHPRAYIGPDVTLGEGVVVGPNAMVPRDNHVGDGAVVYYNATVGHDARVGDFAYIAPGVVLGGHSTIGEETFVGLNVSVLPNVRVGRRVTIGAGSVVTSDLDDDVTVAGAPARTLPTRPT